MNIHSAERNREISWIRKRKYVAQSLVASLYVTFEKSLRGKLFIHSSGQAYKCFGIVTPVLYLRNISVLIHVQKMLNYY